VPRAGLSPDAVVDLAIDLIDDGDGAALTLTAVAARARRSHAIAVQARWQPRRAALPGLAAGMAGADRADRRRGDRPFRRTGAARATARLPVLRRRPPPPVPRAMDQAPLSDARTAAVGARLMAIVLAVLGGFGLEGSAAIHGARSVRSAAHGFAVLEADGGFGFPEDLDASYERSCKWSSPGSAPPNGTPHLTAPGVKHITDVPSPPRNQSRPGTAGALSWGSSASPERRTPLEQGGPTPT
jgi:hypothetical protein